MRPQRESLERSAEVGLGVGRVHGPARPDNDPDNGI
jgi:hypothetical protein